MTMASMQGLPVDAGAQRYVLNGPTRMTGEGVSLD